MEVVRRLEEQNAPFEKKEVSALQGQLQLIETTLARELPKARGSLHKNVSFLGEALERMGRRDWLILALGTFATIFQEMSLPPRTAQQWVAVIEKALVPFFSDASFVH